MRFGRRPPRAPDVGGDLWGGFIPRGLVKQGIADVVRAASGGRRRRSPGDPEPPSSRFPWRIFLLALLALSAAAAAALWHRAG